MDKLINAKVAHDKDKLLTAKSIRIDKLVKGAKSKALKG